MIYIFIFLFGIIIGSFLNVCIYRIPAGKSIVNPPSSCGSCGVKLNYIDMIPVINYIINKGKCRYCGEKYSLQYPAIELLNGILYLTLYTKYGINVYFIVYSLLSSILIIISFIDYRYKIIPDRVIIAGFICSIILNIVHYNIILDKFLGMLIGFGIFMLIAVVTNAMGGGDIKLMALLGFIFGINGVLFITAACFILGAIISILLLILKIKGRKDEIPFGPFISIAALLYMLYGDLILGYYYSLFIFN